MSRTAETIPFVTLPSKPKRIANDDNALAFLGRSSIERERADQICRRVNFQQRHITLSVHGEDILDRKGVARIQMHFGAISAFDHMPVCDHAIHIDEKAAPARKFFTSGIEGFNCYRGRFDPADQFWKLILCEISSRRDGKQGGAAKESQDPQADCGGINFHAFPV